MQTSQDSKPESRYIWVVAAVALLASLVMVLLVFRRQGLVANAGDPYDYGKIAQGFVREGFTTLTRRAASLYPTFLSFVYRTGAGNGTVQLIQCLLHTGTCVLVFS